MFNFGHVIKEYRIMAGLDQIALAKKLRIAPTYISKIENGRKQPSFALLKKFCRELQVPPEVFFWQSIEIDQNLSSDQLKALKTAQKIIQRCFPSKKT